MTLTISISNFAADLVWPALLLEQRMIAGLPIAAGLVAEWLVLWLCGFRLTLEKSGRCRSFVMNTVSSLVGIPLIPFLGFVWEFFPGVIIQKFLHVGTFNPITWIATPVLATFATTVVEAIVVRCGFKIALGQSRFGPYSWRTRSALGSHLPSLFLHPPQL